jgi:hypothetical protein
MAARYYLDFGTSYSTLALHSKGHAFLCWLEGEAASLHGAVFFDFEDPSVRFGRDVIGTCIERVGLS